MREPIHSNARPPRSRLFVVLRSFVVATIAALIVTRVVPPPATDVVQGKTALV